MDIEFEATFTNINKDTMRQKLQTVGAELVKPEFMQVRVVFELPGGKEINKGWLRVRNEGDRITMSHKLIDGDAIQNQKEICLQVDNFDKAVSFLKSIGSEEKAYQESKREVWKINDVEVTIDEWPYLEPFVEIEGASEQAVKGVANILDFDYTLAKFCCATTLYSEKYKVSDNLINMSTPRITFSDPNPFIKNE